MILPFSFHIRLLFGSYLKIDPALTFKKKNIDFQNANFLDKILIFLTRFIFLEMNSNTIVLQPRRHIIVHLSTIFYVLRPQFTLYYLNMTCSTSSYLCCPWVTDYVARTLKNVVASMSEPPKIQYLWRIQHTLRDIFRKSEQHRLHVIFDLGKKSFFRKFICILSLVWRSITGENFPRTGKPLSFTDNFCKMQDDYICGEWRHLHNRLH